MTANAKRKYRVRLKLGLGSVCILASRIVEEGSIVRFYQGDSVVAQYAKTLVLAVQEDQDPARDPSRHPGTGAGLQTEASGDA